MTPRLALAGAFLGGSLLLFSGVSLGHGGTYRGPGDTVPPGGQPGGSGPIGPGPVTPPGTSGPPGPRDPATGAGGVGAPGGLGRTVATPGLLGGPDLSSWTFWWGFNKERFLHLKARIHKSEGVITTSFADAVIAGSKLGRDTMRPSPDQISGRVVPALRAALEGETNKDVLTGALVALAKIGDEPLETMKVLERFLASDVLEVSETAALAYGILAAPEGVPTLLALFGDDLQGRRLVGGKKEVPWRTRSFAAYGLGLVGARATDPEIRTQAQRALLDFLGVEGARRASQKDLRVATVVALGLVPDPDRRAVAALIDYFEANRKTEEIICAHVPNA
ncbi:MAG TPA: HEAT repeat domain-containing protein, partial [Planctomycetota bacterium]|nr:HEAT repeat domain-containing protein [Planctomycetota bacterium]